MDTVGNKHLKDRLKYRLHLVTNRLARKELVDLIESGKAQGVLSITNTKTFYRVPVTGKVRDLNPGTFLSTIVVLYNKTQKKILTVITERMLEEDLAAVEALKETNSWKPKYAASRTKYKAEGGL
jgi:hypothetical protein